MLVDVTPHLDWSRAIACRVARAHRFRAESQEEADIVSAGWVRLLKMAPRFDAALVPPGGEPDGAFRGWAYRELRKECQREARRLRNGGTYNTRRPPPAGSRLAEAVPFSVLDNPGNREGPDAESVHNVVGRRPSENVVPPTMPAEFQGRASEPPGLFCTAPECDPPPGPARVAFYPARRPASSRGL